MEEEKKRLQNILATGKEETPVSPPETPAAKDPEVSEERFEEGGARQEFCMFKTDQN